MFCDIIYVYIYLYIYIYVPRQQSWQNESPPNLILFFNQDPLNDFQMARKVPIEAMPYHIYKHVSFVLPWPNRMSIGLCRTGNLFYSNQSQIKNAHKSIITNTCRISLWSGTRIHQLEEDYTSFRCFGARGRGGGSFGAFFSYQRRLSSQVT